MTSFAWLKSATVGGMLALAASPVAAEQLRFAIGYPPGSDPVKVMESYAARVSELSGGDLTVQVYPSSLLSFPETSAGVRDGIADMGLLATGYHPTEYPYNNLVPNTTIQLVNMGTRVSGREALVFASALTEFVLFHCPECLTEFAAQNQVFTSIASTSAYWMMCNQPVNDLASLEGLRMRAPTNWARWAEYMGAAPVNVALGEMNEAMSQGVVDCLVASAPELINWNLAEVINDITLQVPGGVAAGAPVNINADTWKGLSPEKRTILMQAAAFSQAEYAWMFHQREAEAFERARAAGATIHDPDPAILERTIAFVAEDTAKMVADYKTTYDVQNGEQMLADFAPLLEKWVGLTEGIESSEALADLLWKEIYSRVDVNTYGL
ncbi:C4-dicarboxylate ABC transporter substrate-binding protein [Paracoccus sp. YIM 132242]|uniref:C4-dicarboxylate ABC transporter substrate-binding protein n=1 Tax=Paracoccus lichenicola TaxID=2665644 RepID=A0A6L6HM95_9RHOB|nr:C4-dicarboxylate TRAP transporter substrate-binding protein [Paracoccus lichenicola]MTE00294.1 C4-dicarboxylate ABC transporter substrate-binding protein [Paracoccus lichenicola]